VKNAFMETTGEISVFYYEDHEVQPGLPILPFLFKLKNKTIPIQGIYSCTFCGNTESHKSGNAECRICEKSEWVEAIQTLRKT
jgi:uncharacterized membrane protein YcaP (DUF421 family)